jgi:hypothetical protein
MKKVKIDPEVFGKNYYFTEITQEISDTCVFLLGLMFCMKDCMHLVDLDYPFQTFVYLNGDIARYVHYRPSYDDISTDAGYSLPFEHIYDRIDNGNEDLLLLLVSLYGLMDAEELLAALKARPVFPPDPLLDSICRSSNGYLIYREQIEELYMHLTLCDESEAIKFRKDWNKKNTSGRAVARSLAYSDNVTLEDVIHQRKIADGFDFFVPARYRELENLKHGIRNHPRTN